MNWLGRKVTLEGAIINVLSGYEFFSLTTGKTPPLTHFIRQMPLLVKVGLVAALTVWEIIHFEILKRA